MKSRRKKSIITMSFTSRSRNSAGKSMMDGGRRLSTLCGNTCLIIDNAVPRTRKDLGAAFLRNYKPSHKKSLWVAASAATSKHQQKLGFSPAGCRASRKNRLDK